MQVVLADSLVYHDDPRCSPETVEKAMTRLAALFPGTKWLGGLQAYLPYLPSTAGSPFPMTVFDMTLGRSSEAGAWNELVEQAACCVCRAADCTTLRPRLPAAHAVHCRSP
jgi:hypothetical protein